MNKKLLIIILTILLIGRIILYIFINNIVIIKGEKIDRYSAYIKLNQPIKLDYSIKCTLYSDETEKCEEPLVDNYELLTDKSKKEFKDIELPIENNMIDFINNTISKLSEKNIETKEIEIYSNWDKINNYFESNINNIDNNINISINPENKEKNDKIENKNIYKNSDNKQNVRKFEYKSKTNEEKKEQDEQLKKEQEEKEKQEKTIKLSDNIKYCHTIQTYKCLNCFSNDLIKILKESQGYNVSKSSASEITFKKITQLTGIYNNKKYFGKDLTNKVLASGGKEVNITGKCDEDLTKNICKQFNLICE